VSEWAAGRNRKSAAAYFLERRGARAPCWNAMKSATGVVLWQRRCHCAEATCRLNKLGRIKQALKSTTRYAEADCTWRVGLASALARWLWCSAGRMTEAGSLPCRVWRLGNDLANNSMSAGERSTADVAQRILDEIYRTRAAWGSGGKEAALDEVMVDPETVDSEGALREREPA